MVSPMINRIFKILYEIVRDKGKTEKIEKAEHKPSAHSEAPGTTASQLVSRGLTNVYKLTPS